MSLETLVKFSNQYFNYDKITMLNDEKGKPYFKDINGFVSIATKVQKMDGLIDNVKSYLNKADVKSVSGSSYTYSNPTITEVPTNTIPSIIIPSSSIGNSTK